MLSFSLLAVVPLLNLAFASQFPSKPHDLKVIESKLNKGVSLSYKKTKICETTSGVKSYSGYIRLPPNDSEERPFEVNTFFWFFESRKDPANAPFSIWIQGGPGVPSISAALGENGPCYINEDSRTTYLNKWSWNNEVNMLYIDQPVGAGFSYDDLVNGTIDQLSSPTVGAVNVTARDFSVESVPDLNNQTFFAGTFASQSTSKTLNTTADAAIAAWHFMQTFTQEFPAYKPPNNEVSIWTESYGGHWGPTFGEYFESQNDILAKGELSGSATPLRLKTLGIINGCMDLPTQMPYYPQFAFNNTYSIKAINETAFKAATAAVPMCLNATQACREAVEADDPENKGNNPLVSAACARAYKTCFGTVWPAYPLSGRDVFDIGQMAVSPFPPKWAAGWLNSAPVQKELGVPLNFTGQSLLITAAYEATGDFVRSGSLVNIAKLLDRGVNVALIYGDRDYQCNWLGGEQVSLAINSTTHTRGFQNSGYTSLVTNSSYTGGFVRQFGNFSFTRVFNAGHQVPYYQPETAYRLFQRTMFGKDLATGQVSSSGQINSSETYATKGPTTIFDKKNEVPEIPKPICYTWDVMQTCSKEHYKILFAGNGIFKDFILVGYTSENGSEVYFDGYSGHSAGGAGNGVGDVPKNNAGVGMARSVVLTVLIGMGMVFCLFY